MVCVVVASLEVLPDVWGLVGGGHVGDALVLV
jgi:hypothetical protein